MCAAGCTQVSTQMPPINLAFLANLAGQGASMMSTSAQMMGTSAQMAGQGAQLFGQMAPLLQPLLDQFMASIPRSRGAMRIASLVGGPKLNASESSKEHFKYIMNSILSFSNETSDSIVRFNSSSSSADEMLIVRTAAARRASGSDSRDEHMRPDKEENFFLDLTETDEPAEQTRRIRGRKRINFGGGFSDPNYRKWRDNYKRKKPEILETQHKGSSMKNPEASAIQHKVSTKRDPEVPETQQKATTQSKPMCRKGCGRCPIMCIPCPKRKCGSCPPCPAPSYCPKPEKGHKCPRPVVCPSCPQKAVSSTRKPGSTSTPGPTGKSSSSSRPSASSAPTKSAKPSTTSAPATSAKPGVASPATTKATTGKPENVGDLLFDKTIINKKASDDGMYMKIVHSSNVVVNGTNLDIKREGTIDIDGVHLFDQNIKLFVPDEKMRQHLIGLVNQIPETTGGKEAQLAEQLLGFFGEKKPSQKLYTKRGSKRTVTLDNARTDTKAIMGHLLEMHRRNRCSCKACHSSGYCSKCTEEKCPDEPQKCTPCPTNPECPVPKGCPKQQACPVCPADDDPDNDVPTASWGLDDIDTDNPVPDGSSNIPIQCKGFTCQFADKCGRADKNPLTPKGKQSGYIRGGQDQIYGEFPSFVRLDVRLQNVSQGICGGVLISDQHVLTAQHCVAKLDSGLVPKPEDVTVIIGEDFRATKDEFEMSTYVKSVCNSKKFKDLPAGPRYDFTVLTLKDKVTFNEYVQPACLPYGPLELSPRGKCFAVGLGVTNYSSGLGDFATRIQKMRVKRSSCRNWGIRHDDRSRYCFTKAGGLGDTCAGDSGGPVLCLDKSKRWTVAGLVSYGSDDCDGTEQVGWVAVYTRVQALLKDMNADCGV